MGVGALVRGYMPIGSFRWRLSFGVLLLLSGILSPARGGAINEHIPDLDQAGEPLVFDVVGRSPAYGFSIDVPKGLKGARPWPRYILIPLGALKEDRFVIVGTENLLDDKATLGSEVDQGASDLLKDPSYSRISLVRSLRMTLGGIPAERRVFRYRERGNVVDMTYDEVRAFGPEESASKGLRYDYSAWLITPAATYSRDVGVFERILGTWTRNGAL